MRKCVACGEDLPRRSRSDRKYCSSRCGNNTRGSDWRAENKEKIKAKNKKDNLYTEKRIHVRIKSKCKREEIPFDLDITDIVIPSHCPILGMAITPNHGRQGYYPDSPSLDRINPKGGYLKGNVRIISNRANMLKSNATAEEMRLILKDLEAIENERSSCI